MLCYLIQETEGQDIKEIVTHSGKSLMAMYVNMRQYDYTCAD